MQRISVVGTSGSGKSTLARQIAQILKIRHVELDALHWEKGWTEAADFPQKVVAALQGDSWVVDGNYSKVRDLVWSRADTVIWLDYTLPVLLWRINKRTLRRCITRQRLWNDNRENLLQQFFTRDSMYWWVLKTYRRRRAEYPQWFAKPEYTHLTVLHFQSPKATSRWLSQLQPRS